MTILDPITTGPITTDPITTDPITTDPITTDHATPTAHEHVLALIEPTDDRDTTLDVARSVVERGGDATVIMLLTRRFHHAVAAYADGAQIRLGDAEEYALARLANRSSEHVGAAVGTAVAPGRPTRADLAPHLRPETTALAVAEGLMRNRAVRRLASTTGLPVIIAPRRAA